MSGPLGSLLTGTGVREKLESELERIRQQLEDRKLPERAKGLLQTRYRWTEEKAYYHIRRLSRRQRAPKRNIAAQVIEAEGIHVVSGLATAVEADAAAAVLDKTTLAQACERSRSAASAATFGT